MNIPMYGSFPNKTSYKHIFFTYRLTSTTCRTSEGGFLSHTLVKCDMAIMSLEVTTSSEYHIPYIPSYKLGITIELNIKDGLASRRGPDNHQSTGLYGLDGFAAERRQACRNKMS